MTHLPESAATPRFREHAARPPLAPPPPREHLAAAESPPAPALHGLPSPHPATARTAGRPAAPLPQAGSNRQAGASPSDGAPAARSAAAGGSAAEVTAVAPERLDAGFRLLAPVSPAYPEQARLLGRGGQVRVELAVGRDGSVERVQVLDETGRWGFGHAVRQAYRGARFSPPTVGGRPVRVLWRQTVIFRP